LQHSPFLFAQQRPPDRVDERILNSALRARSTQWWQTSPQQTRPPAPKGSHMNRQQEKLLIATLAGLIITGAAAFAIQPALAAGYDVEGPARVVGVKNWDVLNVRKWPASYSRQVGEIKPRSEVWVE